MNNYDNYKYEKIQINNNLIWYKNKYFVDRF